MKSCINCLFCSNSQTENNRVKTFCLIKKQHIPENNPICKKWSQNYHDLSLDDKIKLAESINQEDRELESLRINKKVLLPTWLAAIAAIIALILAIMA